MSVRLAANTQAYLYVWDTVVAILESGASPSRMDTTAHNACARIIRLCRREQQRCLKAYDKHAAKVKK